MFKWIHHIFNPHCSHCAEERRELSICNSCETLKLEIERLRLENQRLLDKLLKEPIVESKSIDDGELRPILPHNMPWNARRQLLEAEDRERAKLLKINELEKELELSDAI